MFLRFFAVLALAGAAFGQISAPTRARSATIRRIADRGYLGVGVIEMTPARARELKLPNENGVEIKRVDEGSPAAKAGLRENDVILEVNGKPVEEVDQFLRPIAEAAEGTKVNLTVWRNNAKMTVTATLESRPAGPMFLVPDDVMPPFPDVPLTRNGQLSAMPGQAPLVGFEGETLTDQLAQFFGVKEGVLVRTVAPRTPAERAGLRAGDVVVKVNGTPVTSPREISGIVNSSRRKNLTFTVVRNKKEITLEVELAL
ncbi:MAG TPA: PDZ domain-containing protein, partial [Bryobacteraceae bacterium]|nr:PDZ domain-containing protein [Bryobacteraceae bacterium]